MRRLVVVLGLLAACKSKTEPAKQPVPSVGSAAAVVATDAKEPGDLAHEIEAIRSKLNLPAIAAAVWRDGKLVEEGSNGLRKAGDPSQPVTTSDRWHLGSNTKAMTATLIGIYVDRGTLRWTDTIGQLVPGKIDAGYKDVTLDQLLRHEGGAPEAPPDDAWKKLWADGAAPDARINFVRAILATPPATKPGTFAYSNAGYMIAAAMLEAKAKKPWEQLIRTELFDKLEMKSCGFGAPGVKELVDQPRGHDAGGTPIEPGPAADNPPGLGPAGTVHCSLADYGRFLNMIATGTPALVTPETMQHLQTSRSGPMGYAGGWMVATKGTDTMLVHSGSNTMWYATAVVVPSKHLAFAIVTNKGDEKIEDSLEALLARYLK